MLLFYCTTDSLLLIYTCLQILINTVIFKSSHHSVILDPHNFWYQEWGEVFLMNCIIRNDASMQVV